jgi:two-component system sensor histidine kinase RegB
MAGVTNPALDLVSHDTRSDWVRLRTLLVLRWLAILGQTMTIVTASFYLGSGWSWACVSSPSGRR